ncbi:hypothetical protein GJA_892 [Janthinobacterium agaricidamnosum NBRC 102515 = DSM 9628]|uniref:Uncharacterized protein n=1 Tax=Janthinobacterium agaricidamnosum NBRC 102515 = DSM 9628 TaxID=1349767 RepID=W0V2H3_9BURK|nr:hypothetical protein GJA_892 [Janthinobacterium agaricidamnosum NBRC 102515 = DSM 9628]
MEPSTFGVMAKRGFSAGNLASKRTGIPIKPFPPGDNWRVKFSKNQLY